MFNVDYPLERIENDHGGTTIPTPLAKKYLDDYPGWNDWNWRTLTLIKPMPAPVWKYTDAVDNNTGGY